MHDFYMKTKSAMSSVLRGTLIILAYFVLIPPMLVAALDSRNACQEVAASFENFTAQQAGLPLTSGHLVDPSAGNLKKAELNSEATTYKVTLALETVVLEVMSEKLDRVPLYQLSVTENNRSRGVILTQQELESLRSWTKKLRERVEQGAGSVGAWFLRDCRIFEISTFGEYLVVNLGNVPLSVNVKSKQQKDIVVRLEKLFE